MIFERAQGKMNVASLVERKTALPSCSATTTAAQRI
jgi:hypothetical protein